MATFKVPDQGITLIRSQHDDSFPPPVKASVQVMRLNLAQHTTDRILKTLYNDEHVKLRFGKRVSLEFGKTVQTIQANADPHSSELYVSRKDKPDLLYFSGKLSHTLEVQKAQQATEQSDEALANLQNSLKSMQEQRASNEASFITNKDDVRQLTGSKKGTKPHRPSPLLADKASAFRKDHLLSGITHSTPSSPFLGASFSPSLGPTSAPPFSMSTPSKDKIRLDAIRIPLIHMLAVRPLAPKTIAQNLHAANEDVDKLLEKFAKDCRELVGKRELKDKTYKELDVWKFPYPSQDDRQAATDRAIHAYDRMRVGRSDALWQLLLPEERRGKGECLSKLNFDQPVPSTRTPKPVGEQCLLYGKADSTNEDDTDAGRGRPVTKPSVAAARTQSQNPVHKKRVSEKEAISKQHMRKDLPEQAKPSAQKPNSKPVTKKTKQPGKFKSAEKIVDSDEEMVEAIGAPPRPQVPESVHRAKPTLTAAKPLQPQSSPAPKKSLHKSQLSHSSLPDTNTSAMRDSQSLKPHPQQRNESTSRGVSPRPRNGSSPHKPSPLASSPPENANDPETSSTGKSSNSSTEASSPPSSSDLRNVKASANGSSHKRNPPGVTKTPLKRKLDTSEDDPVAKRHQANGTTSKPLTNGSSSHIPPQQPGNLQRKISESEAESVSSPEKGDQARVLVYEKSRKFKDYYQRYKEMHAKVTSGDEKDGEAIKQLNKMHRRIATLKQEIWDDWEKLRR